MSTISEWFYSRAEKRQVDGSFPMKFKVWGLIDRDGDYAFVLKLPFWTWAYDPQFDRWCWHQRRLLYGRLGWRLYLHPGRRYD